MSFGFAAQGSSAFGGSAASNISGSPQALNGPPLGEITTEKLGFHALAGDTKVQLFPTAWPTESLPPPTSALLSINSTKGLLAAASPDAVIVAETAAVRDAFSSDAAGNGNVKPFAPQLTIKINTRISQLAFSSDGSFLVISAEAGGGLAVYETQALLAGNIDSAFELSTDQVSLRALVPNPASESANLFALVTTNGDLMIADMTKRGFVSGPNGQTLKGGVSCLTWSTKGKQLVAGLGNGTAYQMAPDGVGKADIPRPPDLEGDMHVSSAFWLENDLFLMAYTPSATQDGMAPATEYRLITRQTKTTNFMFQALPEVCSPFGFNRQPSFQFMQRLRSFPPNITDIVILASTSSDDVGLYTRSSESLSNDSTAPDTRDAFTLTSMADDSRRAAIPMAENMMDSTSAIGLALDLSSTANVSRPIPGDELEQSKGPLPAIFILNHLGVLSGWWVVYADSVRQGTLYPGLIAAGGVQPSQGQTQTTSVFGTNSAAPSTSAFGGAAPAFGSSPAPAFGAPSKPASALGGGAFGSPASLGNKQSPWGGAGAGAGAAPAFGQPSFGQPAFGSASPMGATQQQTSAFGSSSAMGAKSSPWGTQSSGSVFGQASGLSSQRANPFGAASGSTAGSSGAFGSGSSGFASFAQGGGFAAAASTAPKPTGESIFKQSTGGAFDASKKAEPLFGSANQAAAPTGGALGTPAQGFQVSSAWTNPNAGKTTETKPAQDGSSFFGSGFSNALSAAKSEDAPLSKEADMMEDEATQTSAPSNDAAADTEQIGAGTPGGLFGTKPATTMFGTPSGGLFGKPATKPDNAASTPVTGLFGNTTSQPPTVEIQEPAEASQPVKLLADTPQQSIKKEPEADTSAVDKSIPEAPLPPEPTSKASYTPGASSSSSVSVSKPTMEEPPLPPNPIQLSTNKTSKESVPDAPLPPDFTKTTPTKDDRKETPSDPTRASIPSPPGIVPPEDDEEDTLPASDESDLDDESSGVDVGNELKAGAGQSPDLSPVSSFGTKPDKNSTASSFQKLDSSLESSSRSGLFGEIGGQSIPTFHPPQKGPQSPRSPSPVRLGPQSALRGEASRSVSAPGVPLRVNGSRKVTLGRPAATRGVYPPVPAEQSYEQERERISQQRARAQAEAQQELSDGEDEKTREYLNEEVPATLELESFIAHQDYVGHVSKPGIPGQVERVYRDINSMVDTLGLNARSLASFVKGHEELYLEQGRTKEDLEKDKDWTLSEVENLIEIQDNLEEDLDTEEIQDPSPMLSTCSDLLKDLSRLKARQSDIKHSVDASQDPTLLEALRTAPLSAEQSSMRHDLRAKYTELQHSLVQCEELISTLKARAASIQSSRSKAASSSNIPTVEAVEKTILKMTSMFEKRSGDIDLLESQMRNLNVVESPSNPRERSPYATPPPQSQRGIEASPGSSMNGRSFYTPGSRRSAFTNSVFASPNRLNRTPVKKMAEVDNATAQQYAAKASRKKQARMILKDALMTGDMRVRTLDDL